MIDNTDKQTNKQTDDVNRDRLVKANSLGQKSNAADMIENTGKRANKPTDRQTE
jgi:hypothetical protein